MEKIYVIHYWNAENPPSSGIHTITNSRNVAYDRWMELVFWSSGKEEWYLATQTYDEFVKFVQDTWDAKEYDDGEWNVYGLTICDGFHTKIDDEDSYMQLANWLEFCRQKDEGKSDDEAYAIAVRHTVE